jgi:DegV family protein with EDD domain
MVLLVVILVLASLLFALLTYWLGQQVLPAAHGTACQRHGVPWVWRAGGIAGRGYNGRGAAGGSAAGVIKVKKVAIVTDSSATVPHDLAQELDIRVVPILLTLDGYTARDGVDLSHEEVYRMLRDTRHPPSTSSPSVGDFLQTYVAAAQEAAAIVSIHLSPKLSGTYNAAATASRLIDDVPIRVLDSHSAAIGQGLVVLAAARVAAAGADLEAVVARAEEVASRVNLLAILGTLEYLHRGGRIGGAAALLGSMLQIKPVLSVVDGEVTVCARPRTQSKAVKTMLAHMAGQVDGHEVHAAVLHAALPQEAEALRQTLERRFDCVELHVASLTPVMGVHTGPGVLGLVYYVD